LRGADPKERLGRWLKAAEQGIIGSMRQIDQLEAWEARAIARSSRLSGRTPPRLISVLRDWPLVTAPMAEELTGASRAAIQRNLAWLEAEGLVQEMTGQGRFRVWRAAIT
jgi:Fic family protein